MDVLSTITVLVVLAALFSYINVRFLKFPMAIGLMLISMVFSVGLLIASHTIPAFTGLPERFMGGIDFESVLLDVMLSFLLFAGALHTDFDSLKQQKWPIITFSTIGVVTSTFLIATIIYYLLSFIGHPILYINALLFGALISPTDPIAVLGILKKANAPKQLEIKIVGESLFNDGIGVVVFLTIFSIANLGIDQVTAGDVALLFAQEVIGGLLLGAVLGTLSILMFKRIDNYETEVLLTVALVMGGYYMAHLLHLSGPLAVVVAGLLIGNRGRNSALSADTQRYLDKFWELLDVFLNAVLFVLIGMELLVLNFDTDYIMLGLAAIPIVLLSRFIALGIPIKILKRYITFLPKTALILTWGGLRGGISIALALSLTNAMDREIILTVTYIVVVFSILVQGLSVGKLVALITKNKPQEDE